MLSVARRRTLSPEFFTDEDLATLPFEARLLYAGLWCYADRDGRLEDRPKYLKAMIFPYDRVDVDKLLSLLTSPHITGRPSKTFIRRYTVDDRQFIEIVEFVKHQTPHPHEPSSHFPAPVVTCNGMSLHVSAENDNPTLHTYSNKDQEPIKGPKTKDQKGKGPKVAYGEFHNVFLTEAELSRLEARFGKPDTQLKIESLSQYIASKGKKYLDHYATILQWAAREKGPPNGYDPHSPLSRAGQETKANMDRLVARITAAETESAT